jgi:transposase-like protein
MRVFPSRNVLATKLFIEEVLKYCDGTPTFVVDSASTADGSPQGAGPKIRRRVLSEIGA